MARKVKRIKNIAKLLGNEKLVTSTLRKAVREALRRHKRAGNPICEWRDGKVVWIPPEEIPVDE